MRRSAISREDREVESPESEVTPPRHGSIRGNEPGLSRSKECEIASA
jgi:hypothetical protein